MTEPVEMQRVFDETVARLRASGQLDEEKARKMAKELGFNLEGIEV